MSKNSTIHYEFSKMCRFHFLRIFTLINISLPFHSSYQLDNIYIRNILCIIFSQFCREAYNIVYWCVKRRVLKLKIVVERYMPGNVIFSPVSVKNGFASNPLPRSR